MIEVSWPQEPWPRPSQVCTSSAHGFPLLAGRKPAAFSWALNEQSRHFELGHLFNSVIADAIDWQQVGAVGPYHAGVWECDLLDNSLIWSGGVYDLFGLERGARITREEALTHYTEESRAKLERLRSHAIRQRLGFTLDVEVRAAAVGRNREVRIIASPEYHECRPVRLRGLKLIV